MYKKSTDIFRFISWEENFGTYMDYGHSGERQVAGRPVMRLNCSCEMQKKGWILGNRKKKRTFWRYDNKFSSVVHARKRCPMGKYK